jgi:hypothetical protein
LAGHLFTFLSQLILRQCWRSARPLLWRLPIERLAAQFEQKRSKSSLLKRQNYAVYSKSIAMWWELENIGSVFYAFI